MGPANLAPERSVMDDNTKHVCEYLDYESQWIELVYPGTPYQRWVLMVDRNHPVVRLQVVLFCPFCGKDFRADCHWQIPGRPQQNEILANAREAGETVQSWRLNPTVMGRLKDLSKAMEDACKTSGVAQSCQQVIDNLHHLKDIAAKAASEPPTGDA